MVGKTIDKYKVLKKLGEGGMGIICLAEHLTLGTKSVLKVLFPHLAQNKAISERFICEAKAQAALKHPNIIRVIDYLESDEYKALVMEYVEGEPLSKILEEKRGPFTYVEILQIVEGPLQALNYAHSRGIVHRDIKPSNIIIDSENKGYITDFGIAMILGMERKTLTGANLGTPHYMSPEQALHPKKIDHRSDIYSIGCIFYELASGKPPFEGETAFEIVDKHKNEVPRDISLLNKYLPEYFTSAIMKALEKNPDDRFSGCGEMLEVLKKGLTLEQKGEIRTETGPEKELVSTSRNQRRTSPKAKYKKDDKSNLILSEEHLLHIAEKLDADANLSAQFKKAAWEGVLKDLTEINTSETNCKELLKYVKERIDYWEMESNVQIVPVDVDLKGYEGMVRIPAGRFEMGDHFGEGYENELPVHTIYISEFWMDRYLVTNKEYRKSVDAGVCRPPKEKKSATRADYYNDKRYGDYPVIYISWEDAQAYCKWKGKRLPTEAEWEYAARGGLWRPRYPTGNRISKRDANYDGTDTTKVGSYPPNGYGLYDMAGNVWEWVNDWYDENYYQNSPLHDPPGPSDGASRVIRGGSWNNYKHSLRVSARDWSYPADRDFCIGFRCAKNP